MIQESRIHRLNNLPLRNGKMVLYWMQQSQRVEFNHALEFAIDQANALHLPLLVGFALSSFPEANRRHYSFMLEGLRETQERLALRGIGFCIRQGAPETVIPELAQSAALLVGDVGYLRVQREWRKTVAQRITCPFIVVESDVIVPVEAASDHEEFAARTLRPKIHRLLTEYLKPLRARAISIPSLNGVKPSLSLDNPATLCRQLRVDERVPPASGLTGGFSAANKQLEHFLHHRLADYAENNSERSVTIQLTDVSVNGFMIDPYFYSALLIGKVAFDRVTFFQTDLDDNHITSIESLEFRIHVYDSETWDTILDSDVISLTFE